MNNEKIRSYVDEILIENFELSKDKLDPEKNLFEDLGLDSLDLVDLVVVLQEKFNLNIRNDERISAIRKVKDIYSYIADLAKEGKLNLESDDQ